MAYRWSGRAICEARRTAKRWSYSTTHTQRTGLLLGLIAAVLLLSLTGCGQLIATPPPPPTFVPRATPLPAAESLFSAQRGTITEELRTRGRVVAVREAFLSFPMAGWIKSLEVLPGDVVDGGDLLTALDVPELIYDIEDREYELEVGRKHLIQSQIELTRTLADGEQLRDEAEQRLIKAQTAYDQAKINPRKARASRDAAEASFRSAQADSEAARARVASAEASLALLNAGPTDQDQAIAKLAIEQAKNSLWAAQANRDSIGGAVMRGERSGSDLDGAEASVGNAYLSLQTTELSYEKMNAGPRPEQVTSTQAEVTAAYATSRGAEARVNTAEAQLQRSVLEVVAAETQLTAAAADVEIARKEVAYREHLYQQHKAIQELTVAIQMDRVEHLQRLLTRSQRRVAETEVHAPFPGVIVSLDVRLGQHMSPYESFGVIADPSDIELEITVPESDIGKVGIGQRVNVELDAFPGSLFGGRIVSMASEPTIWQGKNAYQVRVQFDELGDVPATIRMGADVTLAVQHKENVLLVPTTGVYGTQDRQYVELVSGGQIQQVPILIGIRTEEWVEVLSGLEEGQTVRLP